MSNSNIRFYDKSNDSVKQVYIPADSVMMSNGNTLKNNCNIKHNKFLKIYSQCANKDSIHKITKHTNISKEALLIPILNENPLYWSINSYNFDSTIKNKGNSNTSFIGGNYPWDNQASTYKVNIKYLLNPKVINAPVVNSVGAGGDGNNINVIAACTFGFIIVANNKIENNGNIINFNNDPAKNAMYSSNIMINDLKLTVDGKDKNIGMLDNGTYKKQFTLAELEDDLSSNFTGKYGMKPVLDFPYGYGYNQPNITTNDGSRQVGDVSETIISMVITTKAYYKIGYTSPTYILPVIYTNNAISYVGQYSNDFSFNSGIFSITLEIDRISL